ncbi:MAG: M24 family metallopeptidase [Candidatus Korobacteraceae bacterium]|jgi:Xaa-Pro aminopeptidase
MSFGKESIRAPLPTRELDRRYLEIRKAMKAEGIDILVVQNDNMYLGGYVRYFLGIPAVNGYPVTVLFPYDDDMTTITHGGPPDRPGPPDFAVHHVKNKVCFPYFRTVRYTNKWDAEETVKIIKARGDKKVGVIGLGLMHAAFYTYVKEHLTGVEIVEATDMVDEIKAIKSADELVYVRRAVETQDIVMAAVPFMLRPGRHEFEVRNDIIHMLADLGSEEQLMRLGSAPNGEPAITAHNYYQNRKIDWGDQVTIMVEPNGPGGYYGECARTWVLGEPTQDLLKAWDDALAAQKYAAALSKPGVHVAEIFTKYNEFIVARGYTAEGRVFAHGQGYDLVERPLIRDDEDMTLKADMVLAIHPLLVTSTAWAFPCDDFLVTAAGAERMHKTPSEVFAVGSEGRIF